MSATAVELDNDLDSSVNDGFVVATSSGVYQGNCEIGFVHAYASGGNSIKIDGAEVRAQYLVGESADEHGVYLKDVDTSVFDVIHAYNNGQDTGAYCELMIDSDCDRNICWIR